MANPTINQQINFDASVNLDSASQRRFEQQLGGGFFKRLETAAKKAGSLLATPMRAAGRATANVPRAKVNTGIGDAAKKAAAAFMVKEKKERRTTTRGGAVGAGSGGGAEGSSASTVVKNAMKAFRQSVQQIVKLVTTAIKATTKQIQKIAQAVKRMIISKAGAGPRDPNDPAVKAENKAQAEAARDPAGGSTAPQHVIVDSGKVEVTKQPPPPPGETPPEPPEPPSEPRTRPVISFNPMDFIQTLMNQFNRIFNIVKTVTAGAVRYTGGLAGPQGFNEAVALANELGLTTEEAASKLNEALVAGVGATNGMYDNALAVTQVSEFLGISISELVANSRKVIRNNKTSYDLAAAAAGLADTKLFTVQEAYSIVTSAVAAIGKSGVSVSSMVGRVQKMVTVFGDEIGPAMAQMQEVFRGQSLGDTIKEIMLMGPEAAANVLRKAESELGTDAFSQDTRKMIEKALASGDLIAMAEALQLVGPAAEDLAQTVRGQQLGVGFGAQGLAAIARRQVLGLGAQQEQDLRVKKAAGVLGAEFAPTTGTTTGDVKAAREAGLSITDVLQKGMDEALTGPMGDMAYAFKGVVQNVTDVMGELVSVMKSIAAYLAEMVNPFSSTDPSEAARQASPTSQVVPTLFPANDFIYRGDGTAGKITPINTKDQFFGAKPGGAIDRAIASAATGMGTRGGRTGGRPAAGPTNVTVNINGGDLGKVYEVVRTVLQQSGIRPPAGAYAT